MINYEFLYEPGNRPVLKKVLSTASGESLETTVVFENVPDREALSSEQIYSHLDNLLQYIKDTTPNLSVIHLDEQNDGDGWHLNGGWAELEWANEEILKWWEFVYYNEPPELEEEPVEEEPV